MPVSLQLSLNFVSSFTHSSTCHCIRKNYDQTRDYRCKAAGLTTERPAASKLSQVKRGRSVYYEIQKPCIKNKLIYFCD